MAGELKALHGTTTDFTVTNLVAGIANGAAHVTNTVANTDPSDTDVVISGKITCDASCLSSDVVLVYLIPLDGAASGEISAGNLAPASGDAEVATAANALKMCHVIASLPVSAASDVLYFVTPQIPCAYESFCVATFLVSAAGGIGTTGDVVRYQLSSIQAQS